MKLNTITHRTVLIALTLILTDGAIGDQKKSPASPALQEFNSCTADLVTEDAVAQAISNDVSRRNPALSCPRKDDKPLSTPNGNNFVSTMYQVHKKTSQFTTTDQIMSDISTRSQEQETARVKALEAAKAEYQKFGKDLTAVVEKQLKKLPEMINALKKTNPKQATAAIQSRFNAMNKLCSHLHSMRASKKTKADIESFEKSWNATIQNNIIAIVNDPNFQLISSSPKIRKKYFPDSGKTAFENCKNGKSAFTMTVTSSQHIGMGQYTRTESEVDAQISTSDFGEALEELTRIESDRKKDLADTRKALADVKNLPVQQQIEKTKDEIGNLVGFFPLAAAEILQTSNSKNYGRFACSGLQKFIDTKDFYQTMSTVMVGAGILSLPLSIFVPGSGVGLLVAGVGLASLATGVSSYQYYGEQADGYRAGIAMGLVSPSFAEGQISDSEAKQADELLGLLMAAGGAVNDVKALQSILKARTAVKAAVASKGAALTAIEEALIRDNPAMTYQQASQYITEVTSGTVDAATTAGVTVSKKTAQKLAEAKKEPPTKTKTTVRERKTAASSPSSDTPNSVKVEADSWTPADLQKKYGDLRLFSDAKTPEAKKALLEVWSAFQKAGKEVPQELVDLMNKTHLQSATTYADKREKMKLLLEVEKEFQKVLGDAGGTQLRHKLQGENVLGIWENIFGNAGKAAKAAASELDGKIYTIRDGDRVVNVKVNSVRNGKASVTVLDGEFSILAREVDLNQLFPAYIPQGELFSFEGMLGRTITGRVLKQIDADHVRIEYSMDGKLYTADLPTSKLNQVYNNPLEGLNYSVGDIVYVPRSDGTTSLGRVTGKSANGQLEVIFENGAKKIDPMTTRKIDTSPGALYSVEHKGGRVNAQVIRQEGNQLVVRYIDPITGESTLGKAHFAELDMFKTTRVYRSSFNLGDRVSIPRSDGSTSQATIFSDLANGQVNVTWFEGGAWKYKTLSVDDLKVAGPKSESHAAGGAGSPGSAGSGGNPGPSGREPSSGPRPKTEAEIAAEKAKAEARRTAEARVEKLQSELNTNKQDLEASREQLKRMQAKEGGANPARVQKVQERIDALEGRIRSDEKDLNEVKEQYRQQGHL